MGRQRFVICGATKTLAHYPLQYTAELPRHGASNQGPMNDAVARFRPEPGPGSGEWQPRGTGQEFEPLPLLKFIAETVLFCSRAFLNDSPAYRICCRSKRHAS